MYVCMYVSMTESIRVGEQQRGRERIPNSVEPDVGLDLMITQVPHYAYFKVDF